MRRTKLRLQGRPSRPFLAGAILAVGLAVLVTHSLTSGDLSLSARAEEAFADGQFAQAKALSNQALTNAPFDVRALRVLGWTADLGGDTKAADELMFLAGRISRRDRDTQAWLFDRGLALGSFQSALEHADAMLRRQPATAEAIFPIMTTLLQDPVGLRAMASYLGGQPPWRRDLLVFISREAAPSSSLVLLQQLASGQTPPTSEEISPLVDRLIRTDGYPTAYASWRSLLPAAVRARGEVVFDGQFEGASAPYPFDWALQANAAGAAGEEMPPVGNSGRALHVTHDGFTPMVLAHQTVVLPPGRFRLTVRSYSDQPATSELLRWSLFCLDDGLRLGSLTEPAQAEWRARALEFEVPSGRCPAQRVLVQAAGGGRRRPVDVWYDGVTLARALK